MRPVNIDIRARRDVLQALKLSHADFQEALTDALEGLTWTPTDQLPSPWDIAVQLRGQEYRLGDLASIRVTFPPGEVALRI